jgi:hypothetical protein
MSLSSGTQHETNPCSWRVSVGGKVYGPYSLKQMEGFVAEGRVAVHSIVTSSETGPWLAASDDPLLAGLFLKPANTSAPISPPAQPRAGVPAEPVLTTEPVGAGTHYLIYADIKTRSGYGFERELTKLGDMFRLNTVVFLLNSHFAIGQVRNALIQHLGKTDSLMVVDTTHGKSAWFNLGPQAEAKIRQVWAKGWV